MSKLLELLKAILNATKAPLKSMIESEAFILAFAKLPVVPKWMIKAVVKWTLNKTVFVVVDAAYTEIGYRISVQEGEIILKRINNAQNVNDWNNAINSGMQPSHSKKSSSSDVR